MKREVSGNQKVAPCVSLPTRYAPRPAPHFDVERIILAKGSLDTPEREAFAQRICNVYPSATLKKDLDTPSSRIRIQGVDALSKCGNGKKTLVLGKLENAVLSTKGVVNMRPAYWSYSAYNGCPYGCKYCYLDGARGVWFSPAVRVHVNLEEILAEVDRVAKAQGKVTGFYHGRFQDSLALDPLSGYSGILVPFFAKHRFARQIMLTKSAEVDNLLELEHKGNTILCWSLLPPEVSESLENNVPSVKSRIRAMQRCAEKGYRVRAQIQPVVSGNGWEGLYAGFVRRLVAEVPLDRLGFGGVYVNGRVGHLMKQRLGEHYNAFKQSHGSSADPSVYSRRWCEEHYGGLVDAARRGRHGIDVGPCHLL